MKKTSTRKTILSQYAAILILCVLLAGDVFYIAAGVLRFERRIPGTGKIVVPPPPPPPPVIKFSLYWDEACTQEVTEVAWGQLEPGGSKMVTFYVKNDGEVVLKLSMNTTDWTPAEAEQHMILSWDADGAVVQVGELLLTNLRLVVAPTIKGVDSFGMTIIIIGTES